MPQITETVKRNICDRCKKVFALDGHIIENMHYQNSGYDPRGSGGCEVKGLCFCNDCTESFQIWMEAEK